MSLRNSDDSGSEAERENIPGRKNSKSKDKSSCLFRKCQGNLVMATREAALEKKLKIKLEKQSRVTWGRTVRLYLGVRLAFQRIKKATEDF